MSKKKILTLVLALALVATCAIGGTVAWLVADGGKVENTFTIGDINIEIAETGANSGTKEYSSFVPGDKLAKDTKVTVKANSEACYLFIKITESNNSISVNESFEDAIQWVVRDGWTRVGTTNFWYRAVEENRDPQDFYVFSGEGSDTLQSGYVTVNGHITKDMVNALTNTKPTITIAAAAVQKKNIGGVQEAFAALPDDFKGKTTWPTTE